ncbi:MAG: hypothetical protein IKF90_19350 [Parasporobacterium sp.]|nr:hypothetical protein [Parasporobacterium sp.]
MNPISPGMIRFTGNVNPKDVLKESESAKGVIGFKYEDIAEGTVELSMIKEDKEWKINNLNMPKFDKFSMPQDETAD